jgi:hypothetical protein
MRFAGTSGQNEIDGVCTAGMRFCDEANGIGLILA